MGERAKLRANLLGWGLVHSAFAQSGFLVGGRHVQHLLQHPDTLECVITFQGTKSARDILANTQILARPWCSLPDTTVHRGMRNHLKRMVEGDDWQANIRPKLSSCSKVIAVGTSLGSAMAELFSACANFAPAQDTDFKHISWRK